MLRVGSECSRAKIIITSETFLKTSVTLHWRRPPFDHVSLVLKTKHLTGGEGKVTALLLSFLELTAVCNTSYLRKRQLMLAHNWRGQSTTESQATERKAIEWCQEQETAAHVVSEYICLGNPISPRLECSEDMIFINP